MLKKLFSLALLCCLSASPALSQKELLDRIIVIVDEDVVLQSELNTRLEDIKRSAEGSGRPLPEDEVLREEVLDALILENLQLQLAERVSIRFDDDTLNNVLNGMADQANMEFDQYVSFLEQQGVYRSTREQIRRELTIRELQRGLVNSRIAITDQEIENFLNTESGKEVLAADYLVDHILVPTSAADTPQMLEEKLRYASELVALIEEGEPSGSVKQRERVGGRFRIDGTEFGYRKINDLPSLFSAAVEEMEIGDVGGPIRAGNGFHIIQLVDRQGGARQMIPQTRLSHILLSPNEIRDENQTIQEINRLKQRIDDGESFADIARQNSDDPSTVVAGGDLDWINDVALPIEMSQAIEGLEIGDVTEPFRTGAGWHIVELVDKQIADLSEDFSRNQAENALRGRKFDLELQNWLIEIRDKAFVEFVD